MARPPLDLHDSFTEEGLWWLADQPDDQVAGSLSFVPSQGATLKLLGVFGDVIAAFNRLMGGSDDPNFVTIHGLTMKGKPITVLRAMNTSRQLNMPGIANETWKSNLVLLGLHIASEEDDTVFAKSYIRFEAIETWLGDRPYTATYDHEAKSLTLLAEKPREVPFATHRDFEVTTVGSLWTDTKPSSHYGIDVTSQMAITPPAPQSLRWPMDRGIRLQELASLCAGHFLPLRSIELRGPVRPESEDGLPSEVHVYANMVAAEGEARPDHDMPIISGPELVRFSPDAVQLWFDQYEVFSPAIGMFFTISSQRRMYTNIRMLLAIQALEVFHRRTSAQTVMPPAAFETFRDALVAAIPADASTNMRHRLKGTYQFANEPSLGQRLKTIVANLTEAFGEAPAGFGKSYLRKLVDTRNYYTHFSPELKDKALNLDGMYWASRRVILLLTLLFLQRLGLAAAISGRCCRGTESSTSSGEALTDHARRGQPDRGRADRMA